MSKNDILIDLVKKLTGLLAMVYLGCFVLESILPGIVIEVFNFNLLLFAIVGMISFLLMAKADTEERIKLNSQKKVFFLLSFVFLLTMFVVLYRVSLVETVIYLVLTLAFLRHFYTIFR